MRGFHERIVGRSRVSSATDLLLIFEVRRHYIRVRRHPPLNEHVHIGYRLKNAIRREYVACSQRECLLVTSCL
jgi:hypothetical protein